MYKQASTISTKVQPLPYRIRSLIELLCDGKCHSLFELQVGAELSEFQARRVVEFLAEYGFVELTDRKEKVRLSDSVKELFAETEV